MKTKATRQRHMVLSSWLNKQVGVVAMAPGEAAAAPPKLWSPSPSSDRTDGRGEHHIVRACVIHDSDSMN